MIGTQFMLPPGSYQMIDRVHIDDPDQMVITWTGLKTPGATLSLSVPHTEDGYPKSGSPSGREWFRITGSLCCKGEVQLSARSKNEDAVVTLTSLTIRPIS